jgi:sec-independent protein translocase protein TatB
MFDIGFFELVVVGIVALVVLGPEKLPGTIRTVSLWIGRLRRSFNTIKSEIEKEVGADEIRRQLRNEEIMEKFRKTQSQVQNSIKDIKKSADEFRQNVENEAKAAAGLDIKPVTLEKTSEANDSLGIANVAADHNKEDLYSDTQQSSIQEKNSRTDSIKEKRRCSDKISISNLAAGVAGVGSIPTKKKPIQGDLLSDSNKSSASALNDTGWNDAADNGSIDGGV